MPTTALRTTLRQLLAHDFSNPDNNPNLSGVRFFCATDEPTRMLIEQVELLASEALFDATGRALPERMRAAAIEGVSIQQRRKAPDDETVIRIALPDKSYITVSTARL
ncbi:hypothetical protein KSS94_12970 [Pseudomonas fakonensis]|uniref:Uncharacterized protein n=1 Tax=Pseudomonas fakonensis TaxID=2842355 RepID=A0ABX8NDQ6_9PSED|nr:hypothetical protein [Pseudomonas fakonensis]QXH53970.1 hypothetical protein KSS94_12970 [Pseudomonas fakonensis]